MLNNFWNKIWASCPRIKINLRCSFSFIFVLIFTYPCPRPIPIYQDKSGIFFWMGKSVCLLFVERNFNSVGHFTNCNRSLCCCHPRHWLHSCGAGNLRALPTPKCLLLRHGDPSPGLLSEHRVWCRLRHRGRDVSRPRHQTVGERYQIQTQFRPVQSRELSPYLDWFWQRK